jgi:peptidoglycan/LPS O-acetylase OafA/YrhL
MSKSIQRIAGLDCLRVTALMLVVVFHALGLMDRANWTQFGPISIGSFGVVLFMVISGALIGRDSRDPIEWIIARLKKIYPAYWIATALAFLGTAISGYKPVRLVQFLWQMSGIGLYFAEDLINVATWFIGLLLALYFSVFLARLTAHDEKVLQVLAIGSAIWVMFNLGADYFGNSFAFYGAILAFRTSSPAKSLVWLSVPCVVLAGCNAEFLSIALAWGLLAASMALKQTPRWVAWVSRYSYEFYLLHGIFFVGSMKLLKAQGFCFRSGVAMSIGIAATMFASIVLNRMSTSLVRAMDTRGSD